MARAYKLRQSPLAIDELEHRAREAVREAMARPKPEDRRATFEMHVRALLPSTIRADPKPWSWTPSARASADSWARHGAAIGCWCAWGREPLAPCTASTPTAQRVWSSAAMLAYLTVSAEMTAAQNRDSVTP